MAADEGGGPERRLSRLAHELNNRLAPVLGFSDLLLMELPAGSQLAGWAQEIRSAAVAARALTEELLVLGRQAARAELTPAALPAPAEASGGPTGDRLGRGTVLVLSPDPELRELARAILELHGHRVVLAAEAGEAERLAEAGPVDLLLADLEPAGLGGPALHARLRASRPALPALYLSARPGQVREPPGPLLAKPFSVQSLLLAVLEATGRIASEPPRE
jgi:CheY-like chemotaxis protein